MRINNKRAQLASCRARMPLPRHTHRHAHQHF
jgi:hypothetical protein